jgi:predicted anti-sigma-YlaC factor YlaD
MRCDEIQEGFIDLLYDETGAPQEKIELLEHLRTCPNCRRELDELKQTQKYLQLWKDESPLQNIAIAGRTIPQTQKLSWKSWRYAGIAAMVLISLMALTNTQISWNKNGFSFSTALFPGQEHKRDYYTKGEARNIMKQALEDSELRTNETNYLMMQKMLDTVEQDRWSDLRLIRNQFSRTLKN